MALGLVVIAWNACDLSLRTMIRDLATGGKVELWKLSEILVSELGSVGITNALSCYADEFPDEEKDLPKALRYVAEAIDRYRAYRNYFVHGITAVTRYGMFVTDEDIERDTPVHELMFEGPFATVYQKTAKGRLKFISDHISKDQLAELATGLADLDVFITALSSSVAHFFRSHDWRKSAPLPAPPPLPSVLRKPDLRHPKLRLPPSLKPRKKRKPRQTKSE
jgi:hypothetical protein